MAVVADETLVARRAAGKLGDVGSDLWQSAAGRAREGGQSGDWTQAKTRGTSLRAEGK